MTIFATVRGANLADQLSVRFRRERQGSCPGAIYGALLILAMAVMPAGVAGRAAGGDEVRGALASTAAAGRLPPERDDKREGHR